MPQHNISLFALLFVAGCANSDIQTFNPLEVLDPSPFDPVESIVFGNDGTPTDSTAFFSYKDLPTARYKLYNLAQKYARHRDNMSGGSLIFDIPVAGLAITGVVAAANHFASTTTLGMVAASGGLLGARAYLGPSTKAAAYAAAESALQCLAISADGLMAVDQDDDNLYVIALDWKRLNVTPAPTQTEQDNAAKAIQDLGSALISLRAAPSQLSRAAQGVVQNATKRAQTGLQDINALVKAIQASGSGTTGQAPKAAPLAAPGAPSPPQYSDLSLAELTTQAEALAKVITDDLASISACIVSSGS